MHLDKSYSPEIHWTSTLRTRAGLKPFQSAAEYVPAFTIDDTTKSLFKILGKKGLDIQVSRAVSYIRFHIDVLTIKGDLEGSQFFMHPKQFKHVGHVHDFHPLASMADLHSTVRRAPSP